MPSKANGEGTTYQRKDGRWVASWVEHDRRRSAYAKNSTEAKAKLKDALRRIDQGQPGLDSRTKFTDYATQWKTDVLPSARDRRGRPIGEATKRNYADVLRLHVEPVLGQLPIGSITEADVERVLAKMARKGLSGSYQCQAHKTMARIFRDAKKARLLAMVPMDDVPAPAQRPKAKGRARLRADQGSFGCGARSAPAYLRRGPGLHRTSDQRASWRPLA